MKTLVKMMLAMLTVSFFKAQALECKITNANELVWIESIHINESSGEITLTEHEAQGKHVYKTRLVDFSGGRYTFNLKPQEASGVTNMFLLFESFGKWRLINAGVEQKNGATVLRAIEEAKEYSCSKK